MVTIKKATESIRIESVLEMTESMRDKIKNNPEKVKAFEKDMHVETFIYTSEDGVLYSKMECKIDVDFNPVSACTKLHNTHIKFLDTVDTWNVKDDEEDDNAIVGLIIVCDEDEMQVIKTAIEIFKNSCKEIHRKDLYEKDANQPE